MELELSHYQPSEISAANFVSVAASMVVKIGDFGFCMGGVCESDCGSDREVPISFL